MKIKLGSYKGKKIEYAPVARVEAAGQVAHTFMFEIFDFDAGDYLITDESSLADFTDFGSSDVGPLWQLVEMRYGIGWDDVSSDRLVDIFEAIIARQHPQ